MAAGQASGVIAQMKFCCVSSEYQTGNRVTLELIVPVVSLSSKMEASLVALSVASQSKAANIVVACTWYWHVLACCKSLLHNTISRNF